MVLKKRKELDKSGNVRTLAEKVPVLINYSLSGKRSNRYFKTPDEEDIELLQTISTREWIPSDELPEGYNTEQPKRSHGMCWVNSFYVKRTQLLLSEAYAIFHLDRKKMFLFTSVLPKLTILNRYMPEHGSRALVGPMVGTYYVPSLSVENNVIHQLEFQLKKLEHLSYAPGNTIISTQSTTDLRNISDDSVDYIFVDPPFGSNIMYSELNFMPESWLKVKTANRDEAIINKVQKKSLMEYTELITNCFKELYRTLKPGRWITIEFHNSKNAVWNALQEGIQISGFVIADVRTLSKEKKTVMQFKSSNTVDQDLVISAYKPKNQFRDAFQLKGGSEEIVWSFVQQHLEHLPVVVDANKNGKLDIIPERQAFLLFDRMVAWHLMHGVSVPMDASEFYQGLDDHFLKRDDMYFLPDQVNEYDQKRSVMELENVEMAFAIQDEKGAIQWLNYQLTEPQTYQDLQPKYLQELHQLRSEKMPELMDLLRENFLQDEDGKWYVPDITKAGDVAKLRQKSLLKEFESYLQMKGKLKVFRSEAIRAGFDKLWKEQDYKTIVSVAERLPEKTIQEDANLLMYYDLSTSRV